MTASGSNSRSLSNETDALSTVSTGAPRKWTREENLLLRQKVEEYKNAGKPVHWSELSEAFEIRGKNDCRKRWAKIDLKWKRGAWDHSEDERLRWAVGKHGNCWTDVSKLVATRSPDQCSKHWQNSLNPNTSRSQWTLEHDKTLAEAVRRYGTNWKLIREEFFPDRSRLDLSNRHATLTRQHARERLQLQTFPEPMSMMGSDGPSQSGSTISGETGSNGLACGSLPSELSLTSPPNPDFAQWAAGYPQMMPKDSLASQECNAGLEELDERDGDANGDSVQNMWVDNKINSTDPRSSVTESGLFVQFAPTVFPTGWSHQLSLHHPVDTNIDTPPTTYDNARSVHNSEKESSATNEPDHTALSPASTSESCRSEKTIFTVENLDVDTRGKILDLLCRRKIVVTIEIM